ncbi:MAG: hypothetical protein ACXV3F_13190, partial [Frankiaceae bacterium]
DDQGLIAWSAAPDSAANNTPLVSGTIYLVKVWLRQAQTIANILLSVGCAGSGLTPGQNLAALIDSNGNQRGTTADQAAAWASTGVQTMALTCPYNAAPGWYYVAILSAGTTPPSLQNCNANPGINAGLATTALRMAINGTSQTSIPASFTLSSNSTCGARLWWAAIS